MPAYLIADIQVINREKYDQYRTQMRSALKLYGGRHLARGSQIEVLEGNWKPHRLVVLEFPSLSDAHKFYASPEYAQARQLRENAVIINFVAIDGVDDGTDQSL